MDCGQPWVTEPKGSKSCRYRGTALATIYSESGQELIQARTTIGVTGDEKEETRSRDMKLSRIIFQYNLSCLGGEVHSFTASCLEAGAL